VSLEGCLQAHGIARHLRPGQQALGPNSDRIRTRHPGRPLCSVDIDAALAQVYPNAPRWDYGLEWRRGAVHKIAWVEVHHATSSEVTTVLNKLQWLKGWLGEAAAECSTLPATYHWVATDAGVHIDSARRRKLNAAGLQMCRGSTSSYEVTALPAHRLSFHRTTAHCVPAA